MQLAICKFKKISFEFYQFILRNQIIELLKIFFFFIFNLTTRILASYNNNNLNEKETQHLMKILKKKKTKQTNILYEFLVLI